MWFLVVLLIASLFWQSLIFAPLFFLVFLLVAYRKLLILGLLIWGLLLDLFWVWPLGSWGLFLGLFVLLIYLYSTKYSYYNQTFLLVILLIFSIMSLFLTHQTLNFEKFFWFSFLFFCLSLELKKRRANYFARL